MQANGTARTDATDGVVGGQTSGLALEVLDRAPIGVAITRGPDHRLVYTNSVYRSLFGDRPLDRPVRSVFPDLVQRDYLHLLDRVLTTGESTQLTEAPITVDFPGTGPRKHYFDIRFSTVALAEGEHGVLILVVEVTEEVDTAHRSRAFQRYASLARTGAQVEWVASASEGAIELSLGWEEVTGQPWSEYNGFGWLEAVAPEDREPLVAAWLRAVREKPESFEHVFRVRDREGRYRHFRTRGVPVREDDTVVEWVGVCTDVEGQWSQRRREELLSHAAASVTHTHRLEDTVDALAQVIVPELADGCAVFLLPSAARRLDDAPLTARRVTDQLRPGLSSPHSTPEERFPANSTFLRAVRENHPIRETFPPGQPPSDTMPAGLARWLAKVRANSTIVVPLTPAEDVVAVVTAIACEPREAFGRDDTDLLVDLLHHVRGTLSTVVEFQRTQRIATALQRSLLPAPPKLDDLPIVGRYWPSPTSAEVGGDWYDSFVLADGSVMLVIGDVAGHDLPAAIAMSQLRNMLRGFAVDRPEEPGEILRRLDRVMEASGEYRGTATCVLARIERTGDGGWRIVYSVAGHLPPLLVSPDGHTRFLEGVHDPLLGAALDLGRSNTTEALRPGGTLLLYTDGLVEHPGEHLDRSLERLARHAAPLANAPLDLFCDRLLFGMPVTGSDDIALLALRLPESAEDGTRPEQERRGAASPPAGGDAAPG